MTEEQKVEATCECGTTFRLSAKHCGKTIRCKSCQGALEVPFMNEICESEATQTESLEGMSSVEEGRLKRCMNNCGNEFRGDGSICNDCIAKVNNLDPEMSREEMRDSVIARRVEEALAEKEAYEARARANLAFMIVSISSIFAAATVWHFRAKLQRGQAIPDDVQIGLGIVFALILLGSLYLIKRWEHFKPRQGFLEFLGRLLPFVFKNIVAPVVSDSIKDSLGRAED